LSVDLTINGKPARLIPQVYAAGATIAAYNKQTAMPTYAKSAPFTGGWSISATGKSLKSTAFAPATSKTGSRMASATAAAGSLNIKLSSTLAGTITITTSNLTSSASFTANRAGTRTPKGAASTGHLVINAPAWGIRNMIHTGVAPANTVLFKNGNLSLVVFANRQVITNQAGKPTSIMLDSVDIHLNKYQSKGQVISGDIQIGRLTAN
jgi:hypothetical protein